MVSGAIVPVLIETLWNVKYSKFTVKEKTYAVLIETLWNVKKINSIYYFEPGGRINRNIVECKDQIHDPTIVGGTY